MRSHAIPNAATRQYDGIPIHEPVPLGRRPNLVGILDENLPAPVNGWTAPETATMSVWRPIPGTSGPVKYQDTGIKRQIVNRDPVMAGEEGDFVKAEFIDGEWQPYFLGCCGPDGCCSTCGEDGGGGGDGTTSSTTTTPAPSTTTTPAPTTTTTPAPTTTTTPAPTTTTTTTPLPDCTYRLSCEAGFVDCVEENAPCTPDGTALAACMAHNWFGDPCTNCEEASAGVCCAGGVCQNISCAACEAFGGFWFEGPADCEACGENCCS